MKRLTLSLFAVLAVGPAWGQEPRKAPEGVRIERDIVSLPGVKTVIWLEGINDFGAADATVASVIEGYTKGVAELRKSIPGVRILVGTLTTALNSTIASHGRSEVDAKRKELNAFFKSSKLFDGVVDFDAVSLDEKTGELKRLVFIARQTAV